MRERMREKARKTAITSAKKAQIDLDAGATMDRSPGFPDARAFPNRPSPRALCRLGAELAGGAASAYVFPRAPPARTVPPRRSLRRLARFPSCLRGWSCGRRSRSVLPKARVNSGFTLRPRGSFAQRSTRGVPRSVPIRSGPPRAPLPKIRRATHDQFRPRGRAPARAPSVRGRPDAHCRSGLG